ncbi:hypothetical protein PUR59_15665 [Streptomyces sp. SP18ES09]|uniref:hypothetical protein n=1 Tax=Streptomyces sp. SP18ES09 TaxID=3002532 RepID=UPI002E780585|nr:hypothetical protein [Streptomyces sp. SP18ES09]MEE1816446.1 hypothetical protein [Streptomyces sp. SP18ES09]
MTPDLPHRSPADDDIERPEATDTSPTFTEAPESAEAAASTGLRPGLSRVPVVSSSPVPASHPRPEHPPTAPAASVADRPPTAEAVEAVGAEPPAEVGAYAAPEGPVDGQSQAAPEASTAPEPRVGAESHAAPEGPADVEPYAAPEGPVDGQSQAAAEAPAAPESPVDEDAPEESGDEAVRTLLRTAATERPVEEVATLVARLQETGELSSPADVALRAAAVTRPLDEVRQLLALLNASGYDLHQAETTLRAAAVGRPVEDVVRLVGILGADSGDWQPAPGGGEGPARTSAPEGAAPPATAPRRGRGAAKGRRSPLDGALAAGPGSHTTSPALRSVLRWPAALALFASGLVHLPTDLDGLRSGGDAQALSVVVTVLCLACGLWLAARDTLIAWAAAAGVAVFVIALHGVAGARTVDLMAGSLGTTFAWAKALALLSAVGIVCLAGTAVVRHARAAGAADST